MRIKYIPSYLAVALVLLMGTGYSHAAPNLLANGGFEDGNTENWSVYGDATMEVVQGDAAEGTFYLHLTTPQGANFWDAGLQHPGHVFEAGKSYTLAAFLRSPDGLDINFKPELGADPWTGYGSQAFIMTDSWQEYHVETGVIPANVDPATITFHIAYNVGTFDIDGVRFYEGSYEPAEIAGPSAVRPESKLATAWGEMKAN
jgi:hypothetical protein